MRHITAKGIALIKHFESFQARVYRCPAGLLTIGYGHVIQSNETFPTAITEEAACTLLRVDVQIAETAVLHLVQVPIADGQFDALVSFTYNLGAGTLRHSTLLQKVNQGEHEQVPAEFMRWVHVGDHTLPGLVARRAAEAKLYADATSN